MVPNIYDVFIFGSFIASIFYGFRRGLAKDLFAFFKMMAIFGFSGIIAFKCARILTEIGFLRAESLGLYFLWGFIVSALIVYFVIEFIEKVIMQRYVYNNEIVDKIFGSVILTIEVIFSILVATILTMQIGLAKDNIESYIKKGLIYPVAKKSMINALSYSTIKDITTGGIGSTKEAIFNLFD